MTTADTLQWKFDAGDDEDELQWTAQWRDLVFIVTEQLGHGYVLRTADWADDVAYRHPDRPWLGNKLPRLGKAVDFATLTEAKQYAQKVCDDMEER
jgi:hypothetical protein